MTFRGPRAFRRARRGGGLKIPNGTPDSPKWGPDASSMVKNTGFYIHTLLRMHLQPSWARFLSIFLPRHPEKSSFFVEKVVIFEVFRFFLSNALFEPSWDNLGTIWGAFWAPSPPLRDPPGPSCGLLGPLDDSSSPFLATFWPPMCLKRSHETSKCPK